MKRIWKWLVLSVCILGLLFVVLILGTLNRNISVDVLGELPTQDVKDITAALKQKMRSEILPELEWETLKEVPKAVKLYASVKLLTLEVQTNGTVGIFAWHNTNGVPQVLPISAYTTDGVNLSETSMKMLSLASSNARIYLARRNSNGWVVGKSYGE